MGVCASVRSCRPRLPDATCRVSCAQTEYQHRWRLPPRLPWLWSGLWWLWSRSTRRFWTKGAKRIWFLSESVVPDSKPTAASFRTRVGILPTPFGIQVQKVAFGVQRQIHSPQGGTTRMMGPIDSPAGKRKVRAFGCFSPHLHSPTNCVDWSIGSFKSSFHVANPW